MFSAELLEKTPEKIITFSEFIYSNRCLFGLNVAFKKFSVISRRFIQIVIDPKI